MSVNNNIDSNFLIKNDNLIISRGVEKLVSVLPKLNVNFKDKIVMDLGSSTGGFTIVALNNNAKKVIAVEKGTNQMLDILRNNKNVVLLEKTNLFNLNKDMFIDVNLIMADLSFISLKPVLKFVKNKINLGTELIVLLKPQFEAEEKQLNKGVVKNEKIRRLICKDFEEFLYHKKYKIIAKADSKYRGRYGNLERFYYLKSVN